MNSKFVLDVKGIDIPTPEEVIKKIKDFEKQDNQIELQRKVEFFKRANDCKIGEKIATIISKQLINKKNTLSISIDSWYINKKYALEYIELFVKPMFEEKGWKTYVTNTGYTGYSSTNNCGIGLWTQTWFGNKFEINPYQQSNNFIIILIESYE